MDPISATALAAVLVKVLEGASGEAGGQLWTKLTEVMKRRLGRRPEAAAELEAAPGDRAPSETLAETLAGELVAGAERDPELRDELRAWLAEATRATGGQGGVTNVVGGSAQVRNVVQARDVNVEGDIRFGG